MSRLPGSRIKDAREAVRESETGSDHDVMLVVTSEVLTPDLAIRPHYWSQRRKSTRLVSENPLLHRVPDMMLFSIVQPQPSAVFLAFMLSDVLKLTHLTRD